jgi:hypothetical protein
MRRQLWARLRPRTDAAPPPEDAPRRWNVWELERAARRAAGNARLDEEHAYLLLYLREFAASDGSLPADFDAFVRDSFGGLLDTVSR